MITKADLRPFVLSAALAFAACGNSVSQEQTSSGSLALQNIESADTQLPPPNSGYSGWDGFYDVSAASTLVQLKDPATSDVYNAYRTLALFSQDSPQGRFVSYQIATQVPGQTTSWGPPTIFPFVTPNSRLDDGGYMTVMTHEPVVIATGINGSFVVAGVVASDKSDRAEVITYATSDGGYTWQDGLRNHCLNRSLNGLEMDRAEEDCDHLYQVYNPQLAVSPRASDIGGRDVFLTYEVEYLTDHKRYLRVRRLHVNAGGGLSWGGTAHPPLHDPSAHTAWVMPPFGDGMPAAIGDRASVSLAIGVAPANPQGRHREFIAIGQSGGAGDKPCPGAAGTERSVTWWQYFIPEESYHPDDHSTYGWLPPVQIDSDEHSPRCVGVEGRLNATRMSEAFVKEDSTIVLAYSQSSAKGQRIVVRQTPVIDLGAAPLRRDESQ
ncbi:hypothetical protein BH09MYX1_BH09MYX1_64380 [soil metagenome]